MRFPSMQQCTGMLASVKLRPNCVARSYTAADVKQAAEHALNPTCLVLTGRHLTCLWQRSIQALGRLVLHGLGILWDACMGEWHAPRKMTKHSCHRKVLLPRTGYCHHHVCPVRLEHAVDDSKALAGRCGRQGFRWMSCRSQRSPLTGMFEP